MIQLTKRVVLRLTRHLGFDIVPCNSKTGFPTDFDGDTIDMIRRVAPFTMTTSERLFALRKSVEYIVNNNIPGDIVECGVWKGGSAMAAALTLLQLRSTDRCLYLFDTFEGMTEPAQMDKDWKGVSAAQHLASSDKAASIMWAYAGLEEVKKAMRSIGYDEQRTIFVQGRVEDTLPPKAPDRIALLRLDTDWYESTYHELVHLYPRLSVGGVLLIDDYGFWQGARRAVDQYIKEYNLPLLLNRIDSTGRIGVKLSAS